MSRACTASAAPGEWRELGCGIAGVGVLFSGANDGLAAAECRRAVQREFPHLRCAIPATSYSGAVLVEQRDWQSDATDLYAWDRLVLPLQGRRGWLLFRARSGAVDTAHALLQLLTRYQRLAPRVNERASDEVFHRALSFHQALHDLQKPLVRADYDHALDVWQWVLRLEPAAGRALQLAALFHDVERLGSEADERIEQHAPDYQEFKNSHARIGARLAALTARAAGIPAPECQRLEELVARHELPRRSRLDTETRLLADADALSFFSLNSRGFADYFGPEHTRRKVRYSLGRMSRRALRLLHLVKLAPEIRRYIRDAARESLAERRGAARA